MSKRVITEEELKKHDKVGDCWVLIDGIVYDVSEWMKKHPGGEKVIECLGGCDASMPFLLNHHPRERKRLKFYEVGVFDEKTRKEDGKYEDLKKDFLDLYYRLLEEGWFEPSYLYYAKKFFLVFLILAATVGAFKLHCDLYQNPELRNTANLVGIIAAVGLGMFYQQVAFLGHDAGHNGITHNIYGDAILGMITGNLGLGFSSGWWKYTHNTHHVRTNDLHFDPDVQHLPFLALDSRYLESVYSTFHRRVLKYDALAQFLVPLQATHFLVSIILSRAFAVTQSTLFVLGQLADKNTNLGFNSKPWFNLLELVFLVAHHTWVMALISYLSWHPFLHYFVSYTISGVLHLQIVMNHFPLPLYDEVLEDNFVLHQAITSMAISSNKYTHWFYGGLQFQVEHHLFPMMPRNKLREVKPLVVKLFNDHGLPYLETGFWEAIRDIKVIMQKVADDAVAKSKKQQ